MVKVFERIINVEKIKGGHVNIIRSGYIDVDGKNVILLIEIINEIVSKKKRKQKIKQFHSCHITPWQVLRIMENNKSLERGLLS